MRVCGIKPRSFGISSRERFFNLDRIPCCGGICFIMFFGIWDLPWIAQAGLEVLKLRTWRGRSFFDRHRTCLMVRIRGIAGDIEGMARVKGKLLADGSLVVSDYRQWVDRQS